MGVVLDLDHHRPEHDAVFGRELGTADVGAGAADRFTDVGVETPAVLAAHGEPHLERLSLHLPPVDLHPPLHFAREGEEVRAVGAMNRDPPSLCHIANYGISRHRLATLRIADHEAFDAVNLDA